MNEKSRERIVEYLMKKHGSKAIAHHIEKYFRFTLAHAQKDGMLKIVTDANGEEFVQILKSRKEMEAWFKKDQKQMSKATIN